METQFWTKSWELEGAYTSFHRRDIHPYVLKYLTPRRITEKTILVPLCGKSVDMLYFSQFADRVIGVEVVEKAVLQFFQENNLTFQKAGNAYISRNITIYCCDLFSLTTQEIGHVDVVYDRASLVALPYPMRLLYLDKIEELTQPGTLYFLNTLEYAPSMATAPFSIAPNEVRSYYPNYAIQHVESPLLPNHGMVRKFNLRFLIEHGFVMEKQYNATEEEIMAHNEAIFV
ncbi:class I SAM-dependent methyltransferase [Tellurirhabdus bombi]|uniref:thiopurine S-methyltransferase n=1 Tax=Tellurirhabdus bombi TaxID=2907205 RepID=UPI001F336FB1|nr:thiopurine S-methyltransferase [Tellurirhabdus bombi]